MKGKGNFKYYVLIFVIIVTGVLIVNAAAWVEGGIFAEFADSDMAVLIPIFLAGILLSLWGIIIAALNKSKKKISLKVDASKVAPPTATQPEKKDIKKGRFYALKETDKRAGKIKSEVYDKANSLYEICERFHDFAASKLKLYYDIADIRRFVAGLAVSHVLIMQGMSGTGKTSLAYAFGEFLKNSSTIVPIQPMWKERTDLVGYYNEFTKKFNETVLLQKMYEANYSDGIYITVLDEMNIARVEYYFAEFLSLLEIPNPDGRMIDVVSDEWKDDPVLLKKGRLKLPENMWFIGTANNDDSTFAISDKVYDRAMIINLEKKSQVFYANETDGMKVSYANFTELVNDAKKTYGITRRELRRIKEIDGYMIEKYRITFGNRIMKQLKEYVSAFVACGGTESQAVDDMLTKKVMRKLETLNPVYVRNTIEDLKSKLNEIFGDGETPVTQEYLSRLERTL